MSIIKIFSEAKGFQDLYLDLELISSVDVYELSCFYHTGM